MLSALLQQGGDENDTISHTRVHGVDSLTIVHEQ